MRLDKEIFIHVGLPKAASSFFQIEVFPKFEKDEIFYCGGRNVVESDRSELYSLVRHYMHGQVNEKIQNQIYLECQKIRQKKILLSYEDWAIEQAAKEVVTDKKVKRLYSLFPNAIIILVLRNQIDFVRSSYMQDVYHNKLFSGQKDLSNTLSIEKYINYRDNDFREKVDFGYPNLNVRSLNWTLLLDYYMSYFNKKNVNVLFYENLSLSGNDLLNQVEKIIGLEFVSPVNVKRIINKSLSHKWIKLLSVWNNSMALLSPSWLTSFLHRLSGYVKDVIKLVGLKRLLGKEYRKVKKILFIYPLGRRISDMFSKNKPMTEIINKDISQKLKVIFRQYNLDLEYYIDNQSLKERYYLTNYNK